MRNRAFRPAWKLCHAALLLVTLTLGAVQSAKSQPEVFAEGPGVTEIEGGYVVERGATLVVRGTGLPEISNVYFYGAPPLLFSESTTLDGPRFLTLDTNRIPPGHAISRITLHAGYSRWRFERGEYVHEEMVSEKYLWVVSDIAPLNQPVFEILGEGPLVVGDTYQVLTTITQEAIDALSWNQDDLEGSWAEPPAPHEMFDVEIVRLGRLYGRYEVLNVGRDLWIEEGKLVAGQNISFLSFESSGEYELRLLARASGLTLSRLRFEVQPAPGVNWDKDYPPPVERYPDLARQLVLPRGNEITLGEDLFVEVHWPADMENPPWESSEQFFQQLVFLWHPGTVPGHCVSNTRDAEYQPASYVLDHIGDGVFSGIIPAHDLGVGEYWIATGGTNDSAVVDTPTDHLLSAASFNVTPPDWNGAFSAEIIEEHPWPEQRAFDYRVSVSGIAALVSAGEPAISDFFSPLQLSSGSSRPDAWHGVRTPGARFSFDGEDVLSAEFRIFESDLRQGVTLVLTVPSARGDTRLALSRFALPLPDGIRPQGLEDLIAFDLAPQIEGRAFPFLDQHDLKICGQDEVAERSTEPDLDIILRDLGEDLMPNHLSELVFEVENLGDGPIEATELHVEFAGRHLSDPEGASGGMTIATALANADLNCTTDTVASGQEGEGPVSWSFTCPLPELEGREVRLFPFLVAAPEAGLLHWEASIDTLAISGDLALPVQNEDLAEPEEDEGPVIVEVLPIRPQRGLDRDGDFNTHFPFSGDPLVHAGDTTRHLLLIGRDLPQTRGDAEIASDDIGLNYFFHSSPKTLSAAELRYETLLETGLHRYFGDENDITSILATLEEYDLSAAIIEVSILPGAGPGAKSFTLNGAEARWNLDFADIQVDLFFARLQDVEEVEGQEDTLDRLNEAYVPETVYLMASVTPQGLPLETIRAEIAPNGTDSIRPMQLRPMEILGETLFVSDPVALDQEGFDRLNDMGAADSPRTLQLSAAIDASFAARELPIAVHAGAELNVLPTRPEDIWLDAMRRAAACYDLEFSIDELRGPAPFREVAALTNIMVTSGFQELRQDVRLGHHAALLLLRDQYLETAEMQESRLLQIILSPSEVLRSFLSWRTQFEAALLSNPESPLFKIEVPDYRNGSEPGPAMEFGHIVRFAGSIQAEMRAGGADDDAVIAWIERSTVAAMVKMIEASATARKDVADYGDCDVKELVEIGRGLTTIAFLLDPKLVTRDSAEEYWRPDQAARNWLRGAVNVADTFADQVAAADVDTNFLLAVASVLTLPLAAIEGAAVGALSVAASAVELAATATFEVSQYQASKQEVMRALGMSLVIGDIRYERARAQEKSLGAMIANIALSAASTGLEALGYMRTLQIRRGARIADRLGSLDAAGGLTPAQRADLEAYLGDIQRIVASDGIEALSDAQKRSYDMLPEEARAAPDAEAPTSNLDAADEATEGPLRPDPYIPTPTPRPPDAPPPLPRTPEMVAAIQRAGTSPEGIARFLPYYASGNAPMRALAETGDVIDQAWLDALDNTFFDMMRLHAPDTMEHMLARQSLSMLRESRALVIFNPTMGNVGQGAFDYARGQYVISLNLNRLATGPVHGVQWELAALFVHESGHMVQFRNQTVTNITIGRALREFDSSLKMSLFQRMMEDAAGRARSLTSLEALDFSLDYALQVQLRAFDPSTPNMPLFQTPDGFYNGLFQLTHSEAVARARLFFPDLSERQIIESWLAAQHRAWQRYGAAVMANPRAAQLQLIDRIRVMAESARAGLAVLPN